jgi:hypothetical protein
MSENKESVGQRNKRRSDTSWLVPRVRDRNLLPYHDIAQHTIQSTMIGSMLILCALDQEYLASWPLGLSGVEQITLPDLSSLLPV